MYRVYTSRGGFIMVICKHVKSYQLYRPEKCVNKIGSVEDDDYIGALWGRSMGLYTMCKNR